MEELVTLQYGSFTLLEERAKEFAQRTGCSKWVADETLWGQVYLGKLRREHPDWNTAWCQEWHPFLLESLLYNAATTRWKEHERLSQRNSQAQWPKTAKVIGPEHPFTRTLLGSTNAEILKMAKQVYQEEYVLASQCAPPLAAGWVYRGVTLWTGLGYGQSWPLEWTRTG